MTDQTITLNAGDTLMISVAPAVSPTSTDPTPATQDPPATADTTPVVPTPEAAPLMTVQDLAAAAQAQAAADLSAAAKAAHAVGRDGSYTVQPGDTLDSIAAAIYGADPVGTTLYDVNSAVIGSDPSVLVPGTALAIPVLTIMPASSPA